MRWVTVGEVVSLSLYELRSLSSGCSCRGGGDGGVARVPYRGAAQYARSAFCAAQKRVAQSAIRHVAHRACASHCHARARCAGHAHEHMHACRERLTRTLHARERRRCGNHFTWQHALTSNGKLRSAHWPLADRRPACRWHIWREHALQSRSPPPVLARHMHHPHDVPAINHRLIV